jgi:hypothetical protein
MSEMAAIKLTEAAREVVRPWMHEHESYYQVSFLEDRIEQSRAEFRELTKGMDCSPEIHRFFDAFSSLSNADFDSLWTMYVSLCVPANRKTIPEGLDVAFSPLVELENVPTSAWDRQVASFTADPVLEEGIVPSFFSAVAAPISLARTMKAKHAKLLGDENFWASVSSRARSQGVPGIDVEKLWRAVSKLDSPQVA